MTGVTGTGEPPQGWEIQRHSKVLTCQASYRRESSEEEGAGELMCQIEQQKTWIPGSQHPVTNVIFSLTAGSVNGTIIPSDVLTKGTAWKQLLLHILLGTKDIYWNQDPVVGYLWSVKGLHLLDNLFIMNNSTSFTWKSFICLGCSLQSQWGCITAHFSESLHFLSLGVLLLKLQHNHQVQSYLSWSQYSDFRHSLLSDHSIKHE